MSVICKRGIFVHSKLCLSEVEKDVVVVVKEAKETICVFLFSSSRILSNLLLFCCCCFVVVLLLCCCCVVVYYSGVIRTGRVVNWPQFGVCQLRQRRFFKGKIKILQSLSRI